MAQQKHLVLILAREFASNLATPMGITDEKGRLVYFNEAAASIIGTTFAEAGEMPFEEWSAKAAPRTREGELLSPERRPAAIALHERRPGRRRAGDRGHCFSALRTRRRVRRDGRDLLGLLKVSVPTCR